MKLMNLRELCKEAGVSRRGIQCYEKAGLMAPVAKNKYGWLLYDETMLERAKKIRFMQSVGLHLKEIVDIIDAPDEVVKETFARKLPELEREEERLRKVIEEVRRFIGLQ